MDYYILDSSLRRDSVIEGYQSMIWTERFNTPGDFEMDIVSTPANRKLFVDGVLINRQGSQYVMKIDTVSDAYDSNDARMLKVTGKSLENILDDRVAMPAMANLTTTPKWVIGPDTPANIMRTIFTTICVTGALSSLDSIPFYTAGTLNPAGSIAEPTDQITVTLDPGSVYKALNTLGTTYNLGFRLVKNDDEGQIYFEVYTGNDCTSAQQDRTAVIFSDALDNLANKSIVKSSASYKTVAYVFSTNDTQVVYAPNANQGSSGFDRKILYVDASDISDAAGAGLTAKLIQRGTQALAAQQLTYVFDGEIRQGVSYAYGVDYNLGDIVEEQDETGFGSRMRVTEQIFTTDDTGERSYPTLSLDLVVVPGAWSAWDATQAWQDVDVAETWGNI